MEVTLSSTTTMEAGISAADRARCKKQNGGWDHRMDKEQDHAAKRQARGHFLSTRVAGRAGSLLLLAAAHQTELLPRLQTALSPNLLTADPSLRLARSQPATLHCQLLTLLFLEAVGLRRTWDLRSYTGQALALLTSRQIAYGYRYIERFLTELARVGADEALTEALARWTASLWEPKQQRKDNLVPAFYVDGHRKPVYADSLVPRGLVGRLGKVLGCRALVVLHDHEGHPLLVTTHRGDQHLTIGLPASLAQAKAQYEREMLRYGFEAVSDALNKPYLSSASQAQS